LKTDLCVSFVVHPEGVSVWLAENQDSAFIPIFSPVSWPCAMSLLPLDASSIHVRIEQDAAQWPGSLGRAARLVNQASLDPIRTANDNLRGILRSYFKANTRHQRSFEDIEAALRRTLGQTTNELYAEAEAFEGDPYAKDLIGRLVARMRKIARLGQEYRERGLDLALDYVTIEMVLDALNERAGGKR
jgi:hypothetical protein